MLQSLRVNASSASDSIGFLRVLWKVLTDIVQEGAHAEHAIWGAGSTALHAYATSGCAASEDNLHVLGSVKPPGRPGTAQVEGVKYFWCVFAVN